MTATDATRFAGESYRTRLVLGEAAMPDDKTRLAQEGYQSKLARIAIGSPSDTSEPYKVGEKIGDRYEVSAIHHGALGVVYGCFDHKLKLPRALKTVRARHAHDKRVLSLFETEASVWISLEKHPYIVRAYLVERFNSVPYVITEYVRGPEGMEGDLRGWLGHPLLTMPVAVAIALQIAQGMQHAVRKVPNLVHRDLKPANILVNGDGKAMVTDFGLVHAAQFGAGTPAYMSPEQWRSETLDPRSDIYAYGCILFEMFTAHRLFAASTEHDWETAHLEFTPVALTSITLHLSDEIDQFVRQCLAKDPAKRPQSWDEAVTFFADWNYRLTGKAVVMDFSSLALDADECVHAGYSLSNLSRPEEAIQAYNRALAIDTNNFWAWFNKGNCLGRLKRHDEAICAFERALAIDPNNADGWYNKGNSLGHLKRFDEAIAARGQAIKIRLENAPAWYNNGLDFANIKRHDEAIQAFDMAVKFDPAYLKAWVSKGFALAELKRNEDAIQAFDMALRSDPTLFNAWFRKGIALAELKRNEDAIQAYDQALAIDPKIVDAWRYKGDALEELMRYEDALAAYDKALIFNASDAYAWYKKGNTLLRLDRDEEALSAYDQASAIDTDGGVSYMKAFTLNRLERYEESISVCDRALAINPNLEVVQQPKAFAQQELRRRVALITTPRQQSFWARLLGK